MTKKAKDATADDGRYLNIENYGVIGDLRTAALVGTNGSIDFMCFPRFDSPSIFCATADAERGGKFQIAPRLPGCRATGIYVPDTNVLLTRFLAEDGIAEISNYLVCDETDGEQALVRRVKAVHGKIHFDVTFAPRFNYARSDHQVHREKGAILFASEGADGLVLRLRADVPLKVRNGDAVASFELKAGEHATFVMEAADHSSDSPACAEDYASTSFKRTCNFWRSWIDRCSYRGRWRGMVHRSALALKLLASREFGSIIAAPCFGLPNEIGGERNWDYRYTWLRDASFTTYALMRLGYMGEATAFMKWLEQRIGELGEGSELQIMYGIDGRPITGEFHLDHFEGYRGSKPVRIGSTNHNQFQLDIYGELMDSVYLHDRHGLPISHDLWECLHKVINFVCENWQKPDASIWEVRGGDREFLYSRVMCWVALDRALRLAARRSLPGPLDRWRVARDQIYHSVFDDLWDSKRKAFVQFKGAKAMDASAMIMPLVRMISPTDPRWLSTMAAIEKDLVEDSRVYRYRIGEAFCDELDGHEGTFSICSFWYIECLARSGDLQQARFLFEKMLSYSNTMGLFSEQLGTAGQFLGNVPQAFTHLGLISAAFDLDRRLSIATDAGIRGGFG